MITGSAAAAVWISDKVEQQRTVDDGVVVISEHWILEVLLSAMSVPHPGRVRHARQGTQDS